MRNFFRKHYFAFAGLFIGIANGLFGGGGGMIAVPMLEKAGLEAKKAHATSIAVTLALSAVSTAVYFFRGGIDFPLAAKYVPLGLAGAGVGALALKKIPNNYLKKIFAVIMIAAGARIVFGRSK